MVIFKLQPLDVVTHILVDLWGGVVWRLCCIGCWGMWTLTIQQISSRTCFLRRICDDVEWRLWLYCTFSSTLTQARRLIYHFANLKLIVSCLIESCPVFLGISWLNPLYLRAVAVTWGSARFLRLRFLNSCSSRPLVRLYCLSNITLFIRVISVRNIDISKLIDAELDILLTRSMHSACTLTAFSWL